MTIDSLALLTEAPKNFKHSDNASISVISGTLQMVTVSLASKAAGINATALFFAPLILILPDRVSPPSITNCFIFTSRLIHYYIVLITIIFAQKNLNFMIDFCLHWLFSTTDDFSRIINIFIFSNKL